ncbi:hypothetical protein GE09DRAFT_1085569 [Coniochaeta sp. 2T2.1]|nr:hypothetical protein GE09DRAFT_1085569 [Coniochaeta sp. 2T2.1]
MSSSRQPTLRPGLTSASATPPGLDSPSSTRSRARRQVTQNACVACRKKRTKCDGGAPCSRCVDRNIKCNYEPKASTSKDELRAELRAMRSERASSRVVLQALLLDKHEAVVTRLRLGESIDSVAQYLRDIEITNDGETQDPSSIEEDPPPGNYERSSTTDYNPDAGRAFVDVTAEFRAGRVAPVYIAQDGGDAASTKWLLTYMDAPGPAVPPGYTRPKIQRRHSSGQIAKNSPIVPASGIWTKVTPNRNVVNHLIGLLFTWEFPLFTMVSQQLFLRDYHRGSRVFCSPALVNAMSSLATHYMQPDQTASPADIDRLGDTFFREAMGLLVD